MKEAANPRLRRRVIGAVLVCLVLFGVWYHIPLHRALEATVYDGKGGSGLLQMDITIHRSFFRGTEIRGTMALDGASYGYYPMPGARSGSFLDGLRDKWSGRVHSGYFVEAQRQAGRGIATYMWEDSLMIYSVSFGGFYDSVEDLFLIRHSPDGPSVVYTVDPHAISPD